MFQRRVVFLSFFIVVLSQNDDTWVKYIYGPQEPIAHPKSIVSVSGNVVNSDGLINGIGDTTFTRNAGDDVPSVVIDFGINIVGFLQISFNGASYNSPGIRLAFSEALQYLGDLSDYSRSNMPGTPIPITPGSDQIAVSSKPYQWEANWGCQNDNKVCCDGLHGFRYLKIYLDALESDAPFTQNTGTVNISSVSLRFSAFLATPDTFQGWFESSDDQLNQFWYGAVYTNDLITDIFRETDIDPRNAFTELLGGKLVLHDGAKRDRDPYIGDVAVSGRTAYVSHGNLSSDASKNVMIDLASHQRDDGYIPSASVMDYGLLLFDYPLWWVLSAYDYVLYSGDLDFLNQYFATMEKALNKYYPSNTNISSKLISKPGGYGDYAFVGRDGEAAYYNALYVLGLKQAAECALWLNKTEVATDWYERADVVSKAINDAFWDSNTGAYKTTRTTTTSHSQDSNAISILAGVSNINQSISALKYLENVTARPYGNAFMDDDSLVGGGSQRVYAFMSTFDLRARFETDFPEMAESAVDEIRRLYGWMHTHDPNITYWEGVGTGGSMYQGAFTSAAHGWSSGVASVLTNYVLGIQMTYPGGTGWSFAPKDTGLDWARGVFPTVNGPFHARWGDVNNTYTIELIVPPKTEGTARVRINEDSVVTHNNLVIWEMGEAKQLNVRHDGSRHVLVSHIGEGSHIITSQQNIKNLFA